MSIIIAHKKLNKITATIENNDMVIDTEDEVICTAVVVWYNSFNVFTYLIESRIINNT